MFRQIFLMMLASAFFATQAHATRFTKPHDSFELMASLNIEVCESDAESSNCTIQQTQLAPAWFLLSRCNGVEDGVHDVSCDGYYGLYQVSDGISFSAILKATSLHHGDGSVGYTFTAVVDSPWLRGQESTFTASLDEPRLMSPATVKSAKIVRRQTKNSQRTYSATLELQP